MGPKILEHLSIEDIILSHDSRGISALRPFLPPSYCEEAARFVLDKSKASKKTAIITTGFFILSAQAPETDGPPGAIALAEALRHLDFEVVYVTDRHAMSLFTFDGLRQGQVIEFPITDHAKSRNFAQGLLADIKPALLIAIERCGFTGSHQYLNWVGKDISDFNAKVDYLFLEQENTVAIGDGGNEIGMGNLASQIRTVSGLPDDPALTTASKLIISSVSNWGAYGLVAALSQLCKCDLLPSVEWEQELIREIVAKGAVDGTTGKNTCAVDGFNADQNAWALTQLKQLLQRDAVAKSSTA